MKKLIDEFKKFIMRGNVIDLAVGVVMGNAFSKIVSSLVNDIMSGHDFSNLSIMVGSAKIMYGSFIQNIIDFLIIAASIFVFIKVINALMRKKEETKKEEKKEEAPKVSEEVLLLREIRDSLKEEKSTKKRKS